MSWERLSYVNFEPILMPRHTIPDIHGISYKHPETAHEHECVKHETMVKLQGF